MQEVLATSKDRLSISGWFHGPKMDPLPPLQVSITQKSHNLADWINPTYISSVPLLNETFSEQSYLILRDYIKPAIYSKLIEELDQLAWTTVGPANARHYDALTVASPLFEDLLEFLSSSTFQTYLESITGLSLAHTSKMETRRFKSGDYTLIHDDNLDPPGLDMLISFPSVGMEWDPAWGGGLQYISGTDTLLSHFPNANELMVVFREEDVLKFVKYVNASAGQCERREICNLFSEKDQ